MEPYGYPRYAKTIIQEDGLNVALVNSKHENFLSSF